MFRIHLPINDSAQWTHMPEHTHLKIIHCSKKLSAMLIFSIVIMLGIFFIGYYIYLHCYPPTCFFLFKLPIPSPLPPTPTSFSNMWQLLKDLLKVFSWNYTVAKIIMLTVNSHKATFHRQLSSVSQSCVTACSSWSGRRFALSLIV